MKSTLLTVLGVATAIASTALADTPSVATDVTTPPPPSDSSVPVTVPAPGLSLGAAPAPATPGDAAAPAPVSAPAPAASGGPAGPVGPASPYTTTTATPINSAGVIFGISGGAFWLQDFSINSGSLGLNFKFKTGWGIDVPVGYDFGNGLSLFLDVGFDRSNFQQLSGDYDGHTQDAATGGSITFVPVMANAAYSVNLGADFHWYLGVGIGAVYSRTSFSGFDVPATHTINFGELGESATIGGISDSTWSFGFQAFSGFAYDFNPNTSVHVGYKYLRVNDSVSVNGSSHSGFNSSLVELGFTFKF